ncbi:DUF6712 family protein [Bacteroides ovatus]|uniref:DUF6712 family protein n=1 Tax=Bacteroides ovatus TaxID=28116 RepID=UPI000E453734|nr:DUF6712 family protein [Bacteroides ovatus]RGP03383.1 hypothetical protein DXA80_20220 [Bacteroides ovatus]
MIFNRDNNGSKELRDLTGNYYANNDFDKIITDIELAAEEVSGLIGAELYKKVEEWYREKKENGDQELIKKVQRPIALLATLRMYQKNDLSHEDDGRKFKIATDNSEKLPWEWQLDRDDARHMEDYYKAVDALIRYLNTSDVKEWKESRTYKMSQLLLIRSGADFDIYFPIDKSERTFMLLLPFIKEAQLLYVKKAYGNGWDALLKLEESNEVHFAACKAVTLLGMSIALRRMQLKIIPAGVIRGYVSASGAMDSDPASIEDIKLLSEWMKDDAMVWIDEMKKARDGGPVTYNLLPENDKHNKYMRL